LAALDRSPNRFALQFNQPLTRREIVTSALNPVHPSAANPARLPWPARRWKRDDETAHAPAVSAAHPLGEAFSKVPEVALGFWVIKIAATTLGETGGDALSMSLNLGYAASTLIFFALFAAAVTAQVRARRFHRFLYWAVIVATTLTGTTMADFSDRSLGMGYPGGSLILFALVIGVLAAWRFTMGSVTVSDVTSPKVEMFYWATILFSNTLGTALGDWVADSGPGYEGGALIFAGGIAVVALLYFFTRAPRTVLFWSAFILTRPLGATLGDLLTKPIVNGGLNLSRYTSSAAIAAVMILCILIFPQRAGTHPGAKN
jgi:uncharacterized membrane-anchored protein